MPDPISFSPYLGWVDTTDPNNLPPDAKVIGAADLLRYENFAVAARDRINLLSETATDEGLAALAADGDSDFATEMNARYAAKSTQTALPAAPSARGAKLPVTMLTAGGVYTPGGGTNTADIVLGTTNYHVITDGASSFANWHRWSAIAPQNMLGKGFLFFIKVTNAQYLQYLTVQASDTDGMGAYFTHRIPVPNNGKSPLREGEWVPVWIPWANMNIMAVVGAPAATAIVAVKITPNDYGNANTTRIDIGQTIGIYTDPAATGSVMWSFDDTGDSALAASVKLASHGHRAVLFPIIERFGTAGCLTVTQARRLQDLYGWEIGAHCMTNAQHVSLVGQTKAQIEAMLLECRAWQRVNGMESSAFAYPIGPFDQNAVDAVSAHYGYARTNDELHTPSRLPKPLTASAVALSATANTLASVKLMLDHAAANKSMLNIIVHKLTPSATTAQNEWALADFNALVDYAASLGLKSTLPAQVLALA